MNANKQDAGGLPNELGFEQWYVTNTFDYPSNPLGSRDCSIARKAWHAALEAARDGELCRAAPAGGECQHEWAEDGDATAGRLFCRLCKIDKPASAPAGSGERNTQREAYHQLSQRPKEGSNMKFNLGEHVTILRTRNEVHMQEGGKVIGRAEHYNCEPQYLVRYVDGTGCAVEKWWAESALS